MTERVNKRAQEILEQVWREMDQKMYTRKIDQLKFFRQNLKKAKDLAVQEIVEERKKRVDEIVSPSS